MKRGAATQQRRQDEQLRAWVRNWKALAPVLERERIASIRRADTAAAIEAFDLAYKSSRASARPRESSGLVEQQRWFKRARS